ncbi:MAG: amidohydrolase family protein [Gammaproteobacteria bacterium]
MKIDLSATSQCVFLASALGLAACSQEPASNTVVANDSAMNAPADDAVECSGLYLTNGRFYSMAELPEVENGVTQSDFNSMRISGNRIAEVGDDLAPAGCENIDLQGSAVIPGIIDSHMHFIRATLRPGYDVREMELSRSIPEAMDMVAAQAEAMAEAGVPTDQWITFIGGWDPIQWDENVIGSTREGDPQTVFPSVEQMDEAAGDYPFYIHLRSTEEAFTNSIGIARLNELAASIEGAEDPQINEETGFVANSTAAFVLLKTTSDPREQAIRVMRGFNSVGLTSVIDVGGSIRGMGAQYFNVLADYETMKDLYANDEMTIRVRGRVQGDRITPLQGYEDLANEIAASFGSEDDSMFRVVGLGEDLGNIQENGLQETMEMALSNGWTVGKHAARAADIEAYHQAAQATGVTTRFILEHSYPREEERALMADYGYEDTVAAQLAIHPFLGRGRAGTVCNGVPYRTLTELGLLAGIGTDSTNAQSSNPWIHVYHMVTGLDVKGFASNAGGVLPGAGENGEDIVCPDERVGRAQAIQLYTKGSSWLASSEDHYGTLEEGKLADLVVLSEDFFSDSVSDEDIINMKSLLTLVNGETVYRDENAPF